MNKTLRLLFLLLIVPLNLMAFSAEPFEVVEFSILHTSDIHAHLMAFDSPTEKGVGGYARIKEYRQSLEDQGREVVMLSSGDIFQGTFFYRFFQGIPDIEFMNSTGYNAMTLGNHEFDSGQEVLAEAVSYARFPILAANIVFKKIPQLQSRIKPYTIINAGKSENPVKIALIGLTPENLKEIVQPLFVTDFDVCDASLAIRKCLPEIKAQNPDMIILLSHLGWERELELFEEFPEIDGILGGHTHLAINPPAVVNGNRGHRFMSQPGEWGQNVTRYDIAFYRNSPQKVDVLAAGLVAMGNDKPEDCEIAVIVEKLWEQIKDKVNVKLGFAKVFLDGERNSVRNNETNLGNLVADSFASFASTDMALINGGGIRSSIASGSITVGDCLNVLPFDNYLVTLKLSGASLKKVFAQVAYEMEQAGGFGGFLQVSRGVQVDYSQSELSVKFKGKELDDEQLYSVCTIDFLAAGGNGLSGFTEAVDSGSTGKLTGDVFMKFIQTEKVVAPVTENRIKLKHIVPKHKMPKGILKCIPTPTHP
ncbi:MAG: bifunctional metallophosphatase/5'-nucleotidase [Candidatus Riflebacteria bacterium]|nr:bifunctional metallophosphatase/5'-nucleotidase [Candidatus Riflebacteria bacterium]